MGDTSAAETVTRALAIPLQRDDFHRTLIRELIGTLQDVVGQEEAAGFISIVGQRLGDQIDAIYRSALGVERLTRAQVTEVLVDLERRIEGDFSVIEKTDEKIVLGNRTSALDEPVIDRPAMEIIIANVLGVIAAENLGYSKIVIEEAIAQGAARRQVVVYLKPTPEAEASQGREFFQGIG
jgi:hypothetical protein